MSWLLAAYVMTLGALALAWAIASTRAKYRPVALLLTIALTVDLARRANGVFFLAPAHARFGAAPFDGWARVAGALDEALFLAWPAAIAASALVTFEPAPFDAADAIARRARVLRAVALVWLLAVVALVATYPITRGPVLARCYLVGELAAIVVGIGAIATWIPARLSPEVRHVVIALVVGAELISALAGPWRFDLFGRWSLAVVSHALFFGAIIALQGGMLLWNSTSAHR